MHSARENDTLKLTLMYLYNTKGCKQIVRLFLMKDKLGLTTRILPITKLVLYK